MRHRTRHGCLAGQRLHSSAQRNDRHTSMRPRSGAGPSRDADGDSTSTHHSGIAALGGRVDWKCDYDWALSGHPFLDFASESRKRRVDRNSRAARASGHRDCRAPFVMVSALILLVVLTIARHALADSSVLLVVAGAADLDTAPYELRLRSEFAAEGLEVVTTSGRSQQNILDLEGLARRTGASAALSVFVEAGDVQGRLWVSDPSSNADLVRTLRVTRSEGDPVSVFALRAVEALRGARLELEQQRRRLSSSGSNPGEPGGTPAAAPGANANPSPAASAPVPALPVPPKTNNNPPANKPPVAKPSPATPQKHTKAPAKPLSNAQRRWSVLGSAIIGYDNNGLGSVYAPAIDARYRIWQRLSLGFAFDGPFISQWSGTQGVVHINQELLEMQARVSAWRLKAVELEGIGSVGGSRIAVSGTPGADPKARGTAESAHSLGWTIGAGVGAQVYLSSHWTIGLDLQWLRRFPAPVIIAGTHKVTGQTDSLILGKIGVGIMF